MNSPDRNLQLMQACHFGAAQRDISAIEAAVSLELAHAEAHAMNAEFDRDRLQCLVDRALLDSRASIKRINEIEFEVTELDNETIVDMGREYGLELPELVARLKFFIEWAEGEQ